MVVELSRYQLGVRRAEEDYWHKQVTGKKLGQGLLYVERKQLLVYLWRELGDLQR